ncbi:hypothetical protein NKG94_11620 [Micromonospora sp. M12]
MASPYVAGAAAILHATHPDWSPGRVASALRTTATDTVGTSSPWTRAVASSTWPGPPTQDWSSSRPRRNWSPSARRPSPTARNSTCRPSHCGSTTAPAR